MKKKINKIWGVGLVIVLLVSLLSFAAPVAADDQEWVSEDIADTTNEVLNDGSDITDIAVAADGSTIYIVDGTENTAYRSTDGGNTWDELSLDSANTDPAFIAVAPDDADLIAITDNTTANVYVSTNGGDDFDDLGVPMEGALGYASALYDIAISPADGGIHYIAAAGTEGSSAPNVWYFNLEGTPDLWKETSTGLVAKGEYSTTTDSYKAVAFSPNFPSDKVMVAVSSDTDNVTLEYFTFSSTKMWGASGNLPAGVAIIADGASVTGVTKADLVLSPEFLGQDEDTFLSFIGLDLTGSSALSGIFSVDTSLSVIKQAYRIQSVAYDGTNLVAGVADSNNVYRCANPTDSSPDVYSAVTLKKPGGTNLAIATVVRFAGDTVVAGTTGNMSAFSVSTDLGKTFTDVSMIDSANDVITGFAVNDDASVMYMAIDDGSVGAGIWRNNGSAWQRVLALNGLAGLIVEIAPEDADTVYVSDLNTVNLWVSQNGGDTKWFIRSTPDDVDDLAVESADVLYVINDDDSVYKSTNTGFTFSSAKDTKMGSGHSLKSLGVDLLVAGGTGGEMSYSNDGATSWTERDKEAMTTDGGPIVVTATGLEDGDFIFAATSTASFHIYRWEIGQSGSTWKEIADLTTGEQTYGIALNDGVLYATVDNATGSRLYRSLNPTATTPSFSTTASSGASFDVAPNNIWIGGGKVWAIDTAADELQSYTDSTVGTGPTLLTPAALKTINVNPVSGTVYDITFTWARLSEATTYTFQLYTDEAMNEQVISNAGIGSDDDTVAYIVGPNGTATFNYLPGTTYWWRVRADAPVLSPYSELRSFTINTLAATTPSVLSPANGGSGVSATPSFSWSPTGGTTEYQFKLADNVALGNPIADVRVKTTGYALTMKLEEGKTYYWAVKSLSPVEGDWSALANFTVLVTPPVVVPTPPVVIQQVPAPIINIPAPIAAPEIVIPPAPPAPAPITPAYIWAIIIIGAVLVIAVIVLIVRTRRAV